MRLAQNFLESTREEGKGPYYAGSIEFSPSFGHGAAAGGPAPASANRNIHETVIQAMLERMAMSAPEGADLKTWR